MDKKEHNRQRYALWFAENREHALEYKRIYYKAHPEFAERKRKKALERYHAMKTNCLPLKLSPSTT
jgi:hypothetical protein